MKTKLKRFNKASAAGLGGAIATALGIFVELSAPEVGAVGMVASFALAYFARNGD